MIGRDTVMSVLDLRSMTFKELFYSIFDADKPETAAKSMAGRLDDKFSFDTFRFGKDMAESLTVLESALDDYCRNPIERYMRARGAQRSDARATLEFHANIAFLIWGKLREGGLERCDFTDSPESYTDILETMIYRLIEKPAFDVGDSGCCGLSYILWENPWVADALWEYAMLMRGVFVVWCGRKKHLAALCCLPALNGDQELMLYFGSQFNTTFDAIDAYTGLVYTYGFLKEDGNALHAPVIAVLQDDKYREFGIGLLEQA